MKKANSFMELIRQIATILSAVLIGTNAGVQLWYNLGTSAQLQQLEEMIHHAIIS